MNFVHYKGICSSGGILGVRDMGGIGIHSFLGWVNFYWYLPFAVKIKTVNPGACLPAHSLMRARPSTSSSCVGMVRELGLPPSRKGCMSEAPASGEGKSPKKEIIKETC